ncbi:DUF4181 domain-containing protein [Alkalihalobacillus sp. R86527]|uniref:DUF4181 domain-containing protein n=1 Tax=Alkalihalobacillus sp. R86527 TaxID=3093863 RepID=UPI00366B9123
MRRLLKVEKKKLFSNTYINETHKKVDRSLRIIILVSILLGFIISITRFPMKSVWYLEPWFFFVPLSGFY